MQSDSREKSDTIALKTASIIRIFLVGEQQLFLAGLRFLIQHEPGLAVVGHSTAWTGSMRVREIEPDIILVDPVFGNEHYIDALPDLIEAAPKARVLIVTELADVDLHVHAIRRGARGVVRKVESAEIFLKAIRKVHSGELWINRSLTAAFLNKQPEKADPEQAKIDSLTRKELEVIALLSQGLRNKDIAERLFVAECTVRHHFSSIFDKLGVVDRLELLIYAYQHDLVMQPSVTRRNARVENPAGTQTPVRSAILARSA
jgi:DNA-binding NarL/FixJ family response regulator